MRKSRFFTVRSGLCLPSRHSGENNHDEASTTLLVRDRRGRDGHRQRV
jgi:hypothetical protein